MTGTETWRAKDPKNCSKGLSFLHLKRIKIKYMSKIKDLGTCDLYTAPAAVFQPLKTAGHFKTLNVP